MNRYFISFILTLVVYVSLISIYFYTPTKNVKNSFNRTIVTILTPKPPTKRIKKKTKKIINYKFKKVIKKRIKKLKPKKIIKPKLNLRKIVKKQIIKKTIKPKILKNIHGITNQNEKIIELKKQKFYELIKTTISKNKKYPKKAIKRATQGYVKVTFKISKDGKLLDIKVFDGKNIFYKSVKKAIKDSFPIKVEDDLFNDDFALTLTVKYILQ
jgi:protein TonB